MFQKPSNNPQPGMKQPMPSRAEELQGPAAEVEAKFQQLNPDEKKKVLKGITPELGALMLKIMPEELHPVFIIGMKHSPEEVRDDTQEQAPQQVQPQQGLPRNKKAIFSRG